ncbi:MAG: sensor histidine kinase [Prevotella sp.]
MKKTPFKKIIPIMLMSAFWTTASPIGVEQYKDSVDEAKAECDAYRKINANRDSVSVQSYRAKVNKERNANMVAQEQLSINEEKSMIMAYYITGLVVVLILLGVGIVASRKYNRRLKKMREELNEARKVAENSMHLKSLFLSNMSHEIRTPLNALAGFSAILAEDNLDQETRQQFEGIIHQNSDLLLKLINDVVDFSRQQNGEMQFKIEKQDAVEICRNVVETVDKVKRTAAEIRFESDLDSLTLSTDKARLQQMLINLLVNANKFTDKGSIVLALRKEGNEALFSVTDTGCGIAPEKREKIFNRFEKLDENAQGTGLGLSICRLIIEHLGGKIWVDPDYNEGARFCFTHPINRKEAKA